MPECKIVKATPAHIEHVARNLRPEHVQEIHDATGMPARIAIDASVEDSALVFAGTVGVTPLFLVGVSKKYLLSDTGSVWMMATAEIDNHALSSAHALQKLFSVAHRLTKTERIEQWIPYWYTKGIKWLRWLGWEAKGTRVINGVAHHYMVHEEMI